MTEKAAHPKYLYLTITVIMLQASGLYYIQKIYNINVLYFLILLIFSVSAVFLSFFSYRSGSRKCQKCCMDLLDTCDVKISGYETENDIRELASKRIIFLKKKNREYEERIRNYEILTESLNDELGAMIQIFNDKKQSLAGIRDCRTDITAVLKSVRIIEKHYRDFELSFSDFINNQTGAAGSLNEVIRKLIISIEKEAEIAARAEQISLEMSNTVKSGGDDITKTISLISAVEQLSGKITEIIGVIDNITEQTNLLAMNAAIEAAHAGDAGKGFAVVAGEIQKLSKETSKSSRKISDLVKNVSDTIKDMISNAENASTGLKAIMKSVKRTESIVGDISGAINEQSEEGGQILHAANNLIKSTETIKSHSSRNDEVAARFPEAIEKIENYCGILDISIGKIVSNIDVSEDKINKLLSKVK